jgi:hypothetical protein
MLIWTTMHTETAYHPPPRKGAAWPRDLDGQGRRHPRADHADDRSGRLGCSSRIGSGEQPFGNPRRRRRPSLLPAQTPCGGGDGHPAVGGGMGGREDARLERLRRPVAASPQPSVNARQVDTRTARTTRVLLSATLNNRGAEDDATDDESHGPTVWTGRETVTVEGGDYRPAESDYGTRWSTGSTSGDLSDFAVRSCWASRRV